MHPRPSAPPLGLCSVVVCKMKALHSLTFVELQLSPGIWVTGVPLECPAGFQTVQTNSSRKVLVLSSTLQCQESTSGHRGQAMVGEKLCHLRPCLLGWDRALPTWLPRGSPHSHPGPCPESSMGPVLWTLSFPSASREGKSWVLRQPPSLAFPFQHIQVEPSDPLTP